MQTLLRDLRLSERRDLLKNILEYAVPATYQDVVLIFATVSGRRKDKLMQDTYVNKVYGNKEHSGIQLTTASAVCAMLDLLHQGALPQQGFICQEQVSLEDFLANRFGQNYQLNPV